MFDSTNLVCRLFVAYVLEATHDQYTQEGCIWIVNRFYDEIETYQGPRDVYQHAAMKTPLGFAAFFVNAERQYQLALDRPETELGRLLFNARTQAANTPVDYPLFVRKDETSGLWKLYRKVSRGKYELVSQYEHMIGFSSKTKAEKCARELEAVEKVSQ